ncbi:MAG: exodeoxyribonuclease III [Promethearchaeota archaeon]|nr:MAG: exodeoxyribonuclease III [Candidatus Lokiarchaeota archaeon]
MKLVSWNINGANAAAKKGLTDFMLSEKADVFCFQEVKVSEKTIQKELLEIPEYSQYYWNVSKVKNGHAGVISYVKDGLKPLNFSYEIGNADIDQQGRVLTLEFNEFFLVNCYFTNAGNELANLDEKMVFNDETLAYFNRLREKKSVVICGDFNVAHKEIDLKHPKANRKNAGFTDEERDKFTELIESGYVDSFREFEKGPDHYTWWSYRTKSREKNVGWRIDYFVVSNEFMPKVKESTILSSVMGSDHCPIRLIVE